MPTCFLRAGYFNKPNNQHLGMKECHTPQHVINSEWFHELCVLITSYSEQFSEPCDLITSYVRAISSVLFFHIVSKSVWQPVPRDSCSYTYTHTHTHTHTCIYRQRYIYVCVCVRVLLGVLLFWGYSVKHEGEEGAIFINWETICI